MKILLIGEYSALHKNLKEGLEELGHKAIIVSTGDGFKRIESDILIGTDKSGLAGKADIRWNWIKRLSDFSGFDVVQFINPFVFPANFFPVRIFINKIIKNNTKSFLLGAGDDAYFWKYGKERLKYGPFDDFLRYDLKQPSHYYQTQKAMNFNQWMVGKVNAVIPIMYEYQISYQGSSKMANTIPIPINCNKIEYQENKVGNKLVVFHGLNRYGFKGTRHVEAAFDILKKKYPNDLELIIDGKMPLDNYLEVMRRTNVIIDQVYSHSCGLNALYALAMGKVVLGGAEPIAFPSLGIESSPVINIEPTAEDIVSKVEQLLENKQKISEMGLHSRMFAEQVHSHTKIAAKYLDTWSIS